MLARMNRARLDRLCIKFRNVHALTKHHRPYTDFVWLNQLDKLKGIDIGGVAEHASDKTAATFAIFIGEVSCVSDYVHFIK